MIEGLVLLTAVSTVAFGLVDAVKPVLDPILKLLGLTGLPVKPALAIAASIYTSIAVHASIFKVLGVAFFASPVAAYVITGALASLGAKAIYDRFGGLLVSKIKSAEDKVRKFVKK